VASAAIQAATKLEGPGLLCSSDPSPVLDESYSEWSAEVGRERTKHAFREEDGEGGGRLANILIASAKRRIAVGSSVEEMEESSAEETEVASPWETLQGEVSGEDMVVIVTCCGSRSQVLSQVAQGQHMKGEVGRTRALYPKPKRCVYVCGICPTGFCGLVQWCFLWSSTHCHRLAECDQGQRHQCMSKYVLP
jgi:hypothetical protein